MSKPKILLQVTGSIAAFKAAALASLLVERGFDGLEVGAEEEKMGIRGSATRELIFQDCRVPKERSAAVRSGWPRRWRTAPITAAWPP